jgi:hypothetical protein
MKFREGFVTKFRRSFVLFRTIICVTTLHLGTDTGTSTVICEKYRERLSKHIITVSKIANKKTKFKTI